MAAKAATHDTYRRLNGAGTVSNLSQCIFAAHATTFRDVSWVAASAAMTVEWLSREVLQSAPNRFTYCCGCPYFASTMDFTSAFNSGVALNLSQTAFSTSTKLFLSISELGMILTPALMMFALASFSLASHSCT